MGVCIRQTKKTKPRRRQTNTGANTRARARLGNMRGADTPKTKKALSHSAEPGHSRSPPELQAAPDREREGRGRGGGEEGGGEKAKAGQARPARSPWSPLSPRIPPHPPAAKRSLLVGRRRLAREEEEERREDALLAARHEAVGGALEHRRDLEAALRRDAGRLERAHEAVRDLWFCFVFYGLM